MTGISALQVAWGCSPLRAYLRQNPFGWGSQQESAGNRQAPNVAQRRSKLNKELRDYFFSIPR